MSYLLRRSGPCFFRHYRRANVLNLPAPSSSPPVRWPQLRDDIHAFYGATNAHWTGAFTCASRLLHHASAEMAVSELKQVPADASGSPPQTSRHIRTTPSRKRAASKPKEATLDAGLPAPANSRRVHTVCTRKISPKAPLDMPSVPDSSSGASRYVHTISSRKDSASKSKRVHTDAVAAQKSSMRHIHTTSPRKGAAAKLKEAPMDVRDEPDPTKPADYNPSTHDPTESRSAPSEKILRIVDEIANLALWEASDLSYLLKKKLGLPDTAMPYYGGGMGPGMAMSQASGPGPAAEEEKKPEKTTFEVKLEKFDAAAKIKVIKEVRTFTSLGLKEAKELVEKLPAILKRGVSKEEAEQMVEKLKAVGATAVLD